MVTNKKNLLLLAAIPIYLFCCYLPVAFDGGEYNLSNILCVSAFILCAAIISSVNKKAIVISGLALIHTCLFAANFLLVQGESTFQNLFVYCLFCLPSLMIMIIFFASDNRAEADSEEAEAKKSFFQKHSLFSYCIEALAVVLAGLLITGKEVIAFGFDGTAACLLACSLILIVYSLIMSIGKAEENRKLFAAMLIIMSVFNFAVYIIWANRYVQDFVYLLLPEVVITAFVIEKYPIKVFRVLKQKNAE